jgi:hypothetical protein
MQLGVGEACLGVWSKSFSPQTFCFVSLGCSMSPWGCRPEFAEKEGLNTIDESRAKLSRLLVENYHHVKENKKRPGYDVESSTGNSESGIAPRCLAPHKTKR